MVYSYIVDSQKPTVVSHSLICNFTSVVETNLIIARGNHLEVHTLKESNIVGVVDTPLFGNILSIGSYKLFGTALDVLFVLTDKKQFSILGFDPESRKIVTRATGDVRDRVGKELEFGQRACIDPDNRMIGILLYEGLIKLVPIEPNGLREAVTVSLEESTVLDVQFLYGCAKPTLCVLYQDNGRIRHMKTLSVDALREGELVDGPWLQSNLEFGASMVIPVPSPLNGVLVVGSISICYYSGAGQSQSVEIPMTQFSAYSRLDAGGTRYLLSDHRGNLMVLVLTVNSAGKVSSLVTDVIGVTSIAKTLTYLDNGVVFVGSAFGDSQLIRLHSGSKSSGTNFINSVDVHAVVPSNAFDVLDVYPNIGPVVDMCLVDNDKQGGQRQLVTCSGSFKDGSLRIVRSGIGIQEQASLEVPGIKGMWSLRPADDASFDKFLVQSFVGETRILAIEDEELAECEMPGISAEQPTLYCGNMAGACFVQVTPTSVRLVDSASFQLLSEYRSPKTISVASGNAVQVAIACTGGELHVLELESEHLRTLRVVSSTTLDQDVACLSLRPFGSLVSASQDAMDVDAESSDYDGSSRVKAQRSSLIAVGMWTDNSVRLLALPTLDQLCNVQLGTETQARDILVVELGERVFLMVGLGDGHLITYNVDTRGGGLPSLTNKRKGVLGTHSISFDCFANNGETCVFASCDRPTVIYSRNGKLLFSVVNLSNTEITRMSPFHSPLFPHCLALSSESSLMIGVIEDIQKVHIQSVPLGEAPRRIAYNSSAGAYGICSEKTSITERGDETVNRVLFMDAGTQEVFGSYELDRLEVGLSIISGVFHREEPEGDNSSKMPVVSDSSEFFIVGTARVIPEELEPSKGRLLVFEITPDRKVVLANERDIAGAAFSLALVQGKLAVGASSKVLLFDWLTRDGRSVTNDIVSQPELQLMSTRQGFVMSLFLKAHGDRLLVGDMVRSVSLLQLNKEGRGFDELARDFSTLHLMAVDFLPGGEHFVMCDDLGNLQITRQQSDALTDEERAKLDLFGEFNLGDFVNVFRCGTLVGQPIESSDSGSGGAAGALVTTSILSSNYQSVTGLPIHGGDYSVLYGTLGGSVGSIIALREDSFRFFSALERSVVRIMQPLAGLTHADWRSCATEARTSPQRNTVDGAVVESFLDLSSEDQLTVTQFLNEELNALVQAEQQQQGGRKGDSSSSSALLSSHSADKVDLAVEDVLRRVEDISRLH